MATMADEDRESPAGTVVMALALATEVGGARGHTSFAFIQTRQDGGGRVRLPPRVCVSLRVCMLPGSWLVLEPARCTRSQTGYQAGSSTEQPRC